MIAELLLLLPFQLASSSPARQAKALGVQATQRENYAEAQDAFGKACSLDPKLKDVCFYQGRSLYYLNRFKDALLPLRKSLEAGESAARAQSTIAECLEALGRSDEAEREHLKAIAGGSDPQYKVRFSIFLFRQGRAAEAVEPLTEALRASPNDFAANLEMGRVLFEEGKLPEALRYLESALGARPSSTQANLLAAKVCQRLGRNVEAERHLKAAQVPES